MSKEPIELREKCVVFRASRYALSSSSTGATSVSGTNLPRIAVIAAWARIRVGQIVYQSFNASKNVRKRSGSFARRDSTH